MTAKNSNLSAPAYGYDFVVSTTQASINSGLLAFLAEGGQPVQDLIFLADPKPLNPVYPPITLDALKKLTGGVDPFDLPDGTDPTDARIVALTKARFLVAIKLQIGLPPGVEPKDLGPVVTLGDSANNVGLTLYCAQFVVVQNTPENGFGGKGSWDVWSQPSGKPWTINSKVNLSVWDLDKELNTQYFDKHPKQKAALKAKLLNLSGDTFSLQQLLYDLDSAVLESTPVFGGIPSGSNAEAILTKSFVDIYSGAAKAQGWPLVSITAVSHTPDQASTLNLSSFEREVHRLVDSDGKVIADPTPAQQAVTTLDYLCMTDNHPQPAIASFTWNWVAPGNVDQESGVIAINRKRMAHYFVDQIMPQARQACIKASVHVHAHNKVGGVHYHWGLVANQTPETTISDSGETVATLSYSQRAEDHSWDGATYGKMSISPSYTCEISFSGTTITIKQHLKVHIYVKWSDTSEAINGVDKTITDTYTLSIGQDGNLKIQLTKSEPSDNSQSPNANWLTEIFTSINKVTEDVKKTISSFASSDIKDIPAADLQDFFFPGGQTFAYKSVGFSGHQDLVTEITYVRPS